MKVIEIIEKYEPEIVRDRNGQEVIIPTENKSDWKKNIDEIRRLKPEIMDAIRVENKKKEEERAKRILEKEQKDQESLEADIKSGIAMQVLEIPESVAYDCELTFARRFSEDEKKEYADWFRDRGFVGYSASAGVKIKRKIANKFVENKIADGSFRGCTNAVYILKTGEWEELLEMEQEENAEKTAKEEREKKKAETKREALIEKAKITGEKQVISSYVTDGCFDPDEDCSFDTVTEYIYPDGTTKTKREHCW